MQVKLFIEIEGDLKEIRTDLLAALLGEKTQKREVPAPVEVAEVEAESDEPAWIDFPTLATPEISRGRTPYGWTRQGKATVENPEEQKVLRIMWDARINRRVGWKEMAELIDEAGLKKRNGTVWHGYDCRSIYLRTFNE